MRRLYSIFISVITIVFCEHVCAQSIAGSPEYIKQLTADWKGERFDDGRPKVSDALLERLKNVTIEEAWAELMKLGYQNQYEGDWTLLHDGDDAVTTGRAVTAQFMPMRPDMENGIIEIGTTGKKDLRKVARLCRYQGLQGFGLSTGTLRYERSGSR